MTISGWVAQGHLAVWPDSCPGYIKGCKKFFPEMPAKLRLMALYFFHRQMKAKMPRLSFAETLSHLCWDGRRTSGALQDSLSAFVTEHKRKAAKPKTTPRKRSLPATVAVLRPVSGRQLGAVGKSLNKWQRSAWLNKDGPGSASTVGQGKRKQTPGIKGSKAGLDELEGFGPLRMMGTKLVNDAPRKSLTSVLRRWKRLKHADPLNID